MSWSVQGVGRGESLAKKLAGDFERITYLQGEEAELKDGAAVIVAKALSANTRQDTLLNISCSGSASTHPADGNSQSLSISITPLYGFVE
jgi:hypothetical protein